MKIKQEPDQSDLGTISIKVVKGVKPEQGRHLPHIQGRFLTRACRLEIDDGFRQRIVVSLPLWCPPHQTHIDEVSTMVEVGPTKIIDDGAKVSVLA